MPEEAVQQQATKIQYYDAGFLAEEGNAVYHNLVNVVPTKPPYFNTSFRTIFTQSPSEKGDKQKFFVTKRKGFKKVPIYSWNVGETELVQETSSEWLNGHVTDMSILDGYRYFFYLNETKTKMRIYRQINIIDKSNCSNACFNAITDGHIVNISSYTFPGTAGDVTIDYYPFTPCTYDKFLQTTHVKGKTKFSSSSCTIRSIRNYDSFVNYFYEQDAKPINCLGGDYVFTFGASLPGIVSQVGLVLQEVDGVSNAVAINGTWAPALETNSEGGISKNIGIKIFPEYGLTLHRCTSDGLIHMHHDDGKPSTLEYTPCGDLYFSTTNNANKPQINISSVIKYDQSTIVLDGSTGRLFVGGVGYLKFYYSPLSIVTTDGLYSRMMYYMGLCVLWGQHNLGYFTYDNETKTGMLQELTAYNGFFSPDSFVNVDEKVFVVRNSKDFYNLELQFGYKQVKPMVIFSPLTQFIQTDLDLLHHGVDEVNLTIDDNDIKLFINNGTGNGKVLIYDRYYKIWYKRYIQGCEIKGVVDGIYFGRGIYSYEGLTDDGKDITQIVTMTFGDSSHTSNKKIEFVKLPIGYNSYIEKDKSFFSSGSDTGGWYYQGLYSDLTRAAYPDDIMRLTNSNSSPNETLSIVRSYPIGIQITGAKGVNSEKQIANSYTEFEAYKNYGLPNDTGNDNNTTFSVGKFGIVKVPLGMRGEMHTFELVALKDNFIEFGGFFIGFQYSDVDHTRLENNLTKYDLTIDSGKTWVPHTTTPDNILGIVP